METFISKTKPRHLKQRPDGVVSLKLMNPQDKGAEFCVALQVHQFVPIPQAMKIPDAKAAADKEWKKLETIPAWDVRKVKSKKL